ncbi:MAG: DUF6263 family protein [Planctomycetota bacterium]|jgi:hypothetical protein
MLTKRNALCGIGGILLLLALSGSSFGEEVLLRYRYAEGDVFTLKSTEVYDVEMNLPGMTAPIHTRLGRHLQYKIKAVEGGVAEAEVTIQATALEMKNPFSGEPMTFDSQKEGEEAKTPLAKIMKYMVGKKFTVKVDDKGNVPEVRDFDKIGEALAKKMQEAMDEALKTDMQAVMVLTALKNVFTNENLKKQFAEGFARLPADPVKAGGEWK